MKIANHILGAFFLALFLAATPVSAQSVLGDVELAAPANANADAEQGPVGKKAFVRSLLLPGYGHAYARGRWERSAVFFAAADAGLWLSLFGGEFRRDHLEQSYRTLAASAADAEIDGKNRTFYLNLASFRSSEEFRDVMLRTRQWDRIGYVDDPAFQWNWESESDFIRYRELRDDAESLKRRRSILIAALVTNRLLSGILSARRASKIGNSMQASVRFLEPPPASSWPLASVRVTF